MKRKRNQRHNFREFFILVKNDKNKSNAKAVCICCSQKISGGLAVAQITPGCFTSNKARLCCNHFANCENFKLTYTKVVKKNLSHPVPGDLKITVKIFFQVKY